MRKNRYYQYYVEGETERKLINILKTEFQTIYPGKVSVLNPVQEKITPLRIQGFKKNTIVVLVFDTDNDRNITILEYNIQFLKSNKNIVEVLCIPQVNNLEDELLRSCNISNVKELTGSKSNKEFKTDILRQSNMKDKLEAKNFSIDDFWSIEPSNGYKHIANDAIKIKYPC